MEHPEEAFDHNVPIQGQAPPVVLGMTGDQLQALIAGIVGNLPATTAPPAPRQRLRLHEPDAFTGDRTQYRTWKSQMERYLAAHPHATENELVTVVMSFIRGPAIDEWVNAYADQHFDPEARQWRKTLMAVWADLDSAYTDRIGEHSALQRMRELRQRAGHAAEYFQEYEKLMWMAGMSEDDRMVLEYMKDAICDRFRQAIHNQINMPTTYQDWKKAVNRLDDNYMREQAIIQSRRGHAQPNPPRHNAPPARQAPPAAVGIANAGVAGPRPDGTGVVVGGAGGEGRSRRRDAPTPGTAPQDLTNKGQREEERQRADRRSGSEGSTRKN
ncbi:hypothetical protein C8Q77DRAFT_1160762 [Trametes polyzona]|nr:hypothetical protein C8Q77DRAFT_1160762 [Trametes polyzona]